MLTIVGSLTSPYARFARAVSEELGVPYQLETTAFFVNQSVEREQLIQHHNPLMRIPVLLDGEDTIIDSRVIVTHLLRRYGKDKEIAQFPRNMVDENTLTVILGVIEAGVLCFVVPQLHPELQPERGYLARSRERIASGLLWLDQQQALGERFGIPEMALICALEWLSKRKVYPWEAECPRLCSIHDAHRDQPSCVKTRIPKDM